jgi:hypothetical protein
MQIKRAPLNGVFDYDSRKLWFYFEFKNHTIIHEKGTQGHNIR